MTPTRLTAVILALLAPASAPALAAPPTANPPVSGATATAGAAGAKLDPAIVVDPADGTHRVLLATNAGSQKVGVWRTGDGGATWGFTRDLAYPTGVTSAGLADVGWGAGQRVYAAWLGRAAVGAVTPASAADCSANAGVYLSTSPDGGATWDPSGATKVRGGTNGTSGAYISRGWPVLAVDASTSATAHQPVVAMERTTWQGGSCGAGTVQHEITLNWRLADGPFTYDYAIPGVTDATYPAIVAIPAALPTVAVAYLRRPAVGAASIEVVTCSRDDSEQLIVDYWHCGSASTVSAPTFQAIGGVIWSGQVVTANSAPSLAISSTTNALAVVYGGYAMGDAQVYLSVSDPTRTAWTTPLSVVDDPSNASADQVLPSVSVGPGGRADVVYLDRRDGAPTDGAYRAYATSFRCPAGRSWCTSAELLRGADVPLGDVATAPPTVATVWTVGWRTAAATVTNLPSPYLGHALGYWPLGNDVRESELWHGLRSPQIAPSSPPEPFPVAKNASTPVDVLFATFDPDGDPVEVSTTASEGPAHGTLTAMAFEPTLSFTGPDSFVVHASDGLNAASATHGLVVVDQAPVIDPHDPAFVTEGSSIDVPLTAGDPDPFDVVHLTLGTLPAQLVGKVTLVGTTLHIAIPSGTRSASPLNIDVFATDTSIPPELAQSALFRLGLTIHPNPVVPTVVLDQVHVAGATVTLHATPDWKDPDRDCLLQGGGCVWLYTWDYGDGTVEVTTDDSPSHAYASAGTYVPTVKATVSLYQTVVPWSEVVTASTQASITLTGDARAHLYLKTSSARGRLTVVLQSREQTTVQVTVKIGGLVVRSKRLTLTGGPGVRWGTASTCAFGLQRYRGKVAKVTVTYDGQLDGHPAPDPLTRTVRVR